MTSVLLDEDSAITTETKYHPLALQWLTAIIGFYEDRDKVTKVLRDCKGHTGIKKRAGIFINEGIHIQSSPLLREDDTDCMKEARKRRQVLRDLNRKSYCSQNPTTHQFPNSVDELSENEEPPPKKQKVTNVIELPP